MEARHNYAIEIEEYIKRQVAEKMETDGPEFESAHIAGVAEGLLGCLATSNPDQTLGQALEELMCSRRKIKEVKE